MIDWTCRAALYLGDEVFATGTISDLAIIYGEMNTSERSIAFIGGENLPKLAGDDRGYKIGVMGLALLWSEFLEKRDQT